MIVNIVVIRCALFLVYLKI